MSQDNLPTTLPTMQKLLARISTADKSQQKEIRITIQEARDLAIEIAAMTSRLNNTVSEIHQMLKELKNSSNNIEVRFDGGNFQER